MSLSLLVFRNGQQSGPFSADQARQMLADGSLQAGDMAWREGMADWKPLTEVLAGLGGVAAAAVPAAAVAAGGSALKWGIGAGVAAVLALGGVGVWQYDQQQKLAAEQQRVAQEQQRLAELQAQEQERRQLEEKRRAEEEVQRLAEEKRQAEARSQELEQRLAEERRQADAERRQERQRERQQRVYETRPQRTNDGFPNAGPYGQNSVMAPPPPVVCRECGVVQSVRAVTHQGQGSGLGAVAGGVIGGALGNQVGRGRGRDAATVVGVLGGAVAGHEIEKSQRTTTSYEITVRFDDGSVRVFNQEAQPYWRQGDRVRMMNGTLGGY